MLKVVSKYTNNFYQPKWIHSHHLLYGTKNELQARQRFTKR
jgi:hypothetical protein